jgi:hypothetical protein
MRYSECLVSVIVYFARSMPLPSVDALKKLCRVIGVKLSDLTNEVELFGHELVGYLATPLTRLSLPQDVELRKVVDRTKANPRACLHSIFLDAQGIRQSQ